jgi:hypothetical protein
MRGGQKARQRIWKEPAMRKRETELVVQPNPEETWKDLFLRSVSASEILV